MTFPAYRRSTQRPAARIVAALLSAVLLVAFSESVSYVRQVSADERLRVLPNRIDGTTNTDTPSEPDGYAPGEMMQRYLRRQAQVHFDRWTADYEARTTRAQIAEYQQRMRAMFVERLGGFPERTPLDAYTTGTVNRTGYSVENIIFESQPGMFVTGSLFNPTSVEHPAPHPAVLVVCGHSANGKAYEGYQTACAALALQGIVAFIIDPISQGERAQLLDADGKPAVGRSTLEHSLVGQGSLLLGENTARFEIWDGMRAIDYLQSRPDIDGSRIGCMGNSGGGTQTAYLMALDDRIKAASPSCYITSFERLLDTIGPQDAEQNIFGQIAGGLDHADYLMLRAPTPILMCVATKDFFDITGAWHSFRHAKRLYSRLGFPERISLVENDDTHGYKQPLREAAVEWMVRWLAGRDEKIREPKIEILTDKQMQCTPTGQVLDLPGARSTFEINAETNRRLARQRQQAWTSSSPIEQRDIVRQTIAAHDLQTLRNVAIKRLKPKSAQRSVIENVKVVKYILRPEPGIVLPVLALVPREFADSNPRRVILSVRDMGLPTEISRGVRRELAGGTAVVFVNVRGVGETASTSGTWYDKQFGDDAKDVTTAYLLGRSYVGMWCDDILSTTSWLASASSPVAGAELELRANGALCTAALHAAVLEPQLFSGVELRDALVSWSSVVETPLAKDRWNQLVHGALKEYDLPDLRQLLGDKLQLVRPRSAAGEELTATDF